MVRFLLFTATVYISLAGYAQKSEYVTEYINSYKQLAVDEMIRTGVPASITLAQGIHETEAGRSELVLKSNNHFGIKCKTGWDGEKVYHDDDARGECFRSYPSSEDSYADHSNFLKRGPRYAFLFDIDPTDYKAWAYGLKKAGYATNARYSQILIKLIETYNLQDYSLIALGKLPPDGLLTNAKKEIVDSVSIPAPEVIVSVSSEENTAPVITYPTGEFSINKTRVVFAKSGTSLLALAQQYDLSLSRLLDFNDLDREDVLVNDQLIYLQRKRKFGSSEFHVVQPGETIYCISQTEGIRMETLLQYNQIRYSALQPATGAKLFLQQESPVAPAFVVKETIQPGLVVSEQSRPATAVALQEKVFHLMHIVKQGETLYAIARQYNTTADKIKDWNKLVNIQLKKGQELIIQKN